MSIDRFQRSFKLNSNSKFRTYGLNHLIRFAKTQILVRIYHNPRCRKSRQALQLLETLENNYEVIEYLKTPLKFEELKIILKKLNLKPVDLIRKSENIFKEKYKDKKLTEEQWIEAMIINPALIERPILVKGDMAIIGRPPENIKTLY